MPPTGVIEWDEEMVGEGHATKDDTLNRGFLIDHNSDGSHKKSYGELFEWDPDGRKIIIAIGGTLQKLDTMTVGLEKGSGFVVGNAATDNLIIGANGGGRYQVAARAVFEAEGDVEVTAAIFVNGSQQDKTAVKILVPTPAMDSTPDTITVNIGTLLSGSAADLVSANGVYVDIQEAAATPGFDVEFSFPDVEEHKALSFWGRYDGNVAHMVEAQIWNFVTSAWDDLEAATSDLPHQAGVDYHRNWLIPTPQSNYIGPTETKIRFLHTSTGQATNNLFVDKVILQDRFTGASAAMMGFLDLVATDEVDLRITSDTTGDELLIHSANLLITRIEQ